ncbi:MAG: 2-oxo-4-hydroxy-4-carboxy-5-ureidoimidazoline decarboxylase [Gammaproteobacteria bacterium]|nr:2-oxo-4-hydroxy-4-carboxy-5-ureidoimidazoline decarboxylase [Gammaproteobacteria bacterium]
MKTERKLSRAEFVRRYGGVYEHSPWVAEAAWERGGGGVGAGELRGLLASCVDSADDDAKLALICAHPDLAGRAAVRGELTADSAGEQASAGIDRCTPEEFERFRQLNDAYREKFGFPFVMAVRHSSRQQILAAFERRLRNEAPAEMRTALREIHEIARLRLEALADVN